MLITGLPKKKKKKKKQHSACLASLASGELGSSSFRLISQSFSNHCVQEIRGISDQPRPRYDADSSACIAPNRERRTIDSTSTFGKSAWSNGVAMKPTDTSPTPLDHPYPLLTPTTLCQGEGRRMARKRVEAAMPDLNVQQPWLSQTVSPRLHMYMHARRPTATFLNYRAIPSCKLQALRSTP